MKMEQEIKEMVEYKNVSLPIVKEMSFLYLLDGAQIYFTMLVILLHSGSSY